MSIFDEPKVDCHSHVLDPARFAYADDVAYRPGGAEMGTLAQHQQVMRAYGIRHALLVGPNSGYGTDNTACSTRWPPAAGATRASLSSPPIRAATSCCA